MSLETDLNTKNKIRKYWQERSQTYDKYRGSGSEDERTAYKAAFTHIFREKKYNILDVGTGTGYLAAILSESGHSVTGLDMTEGMLEKAKEKAKESGLFINYELGDAENLHFEDNTFDIVVCRYLLWTLPDPKKALSEWSRVVKPGGQIVIIEGKWRDSSLISHLKRYSKKIGILIYDKVNPQKLGYDRVTDRMLPFRYGLDPETVTGLFRERGLTAISTHIFGDVQDIQKRKMPFLYRISLTSPPFLMKGEKHSVLKKIKNDNELQKLVPTGKV